MLTRRTVWYILSIGLCYTASLLCSNLAYLTLSVSFISMLKSLAPVVTLVLTWAGGFAAPARATWAIVALITLGVFLSSLGEVTFAWSGFAYQMFGTVSESMRLLLIGWLLSSSAAAIPDAGARGREAGGSYEGEEEGEAHSAGLDQTGARPHDDVEAHGAANEASALAGVSPLVLLYYYSPVCAAFNLFVALMTEWRTFDVADLHRVGWSVLALNGAVAFGLNVSSVFLVWPPTALPPPPPSSCRFAV